MCLFVCERTGVIVAVAEKSMVLAKSVAERLVQRLVCCAGMQDARFTSKFLISCNNTHQVKN